MGVRSMIGHVGAVMFCERRGKRESWSHEGLAHSVFGKDNVPMSQTLSELMDLGKDNIEISVPFYLKKEYCMREKTIL